MKKIILLVGLLTCSLAAQAMPIPWSVNSASLTGSFTYDASSNTYSSIDLVETFFGDTYDSIEFGNASSFLAISSSFEDLTALVFDSPLTDAGGFIGFSGVTLCSELCNGDVDDFGVNFFEGAVESTNSSGVPEPSIIALFGMGLLGLAFARRRKRS